MSSSTPSSTPGDSSQTSGRPDALASAISAPIEELLQNAGWLRGLAASLVAGSHDVDDVVQEVWRATLAARRDGAQVTSSRGWLAGTVRNIVRMRHRGDSRRAEREDVRRAESSIRAPSAGELAAEQDVRHQLLLHVDELPQAEREVVLLRYWQSLPPREVAKRLSIPVNTVRSRTARALERLRARLDDKHGDRRAWCLALVPLLDAKALKAAGSGVASADVAVRGARLARRSWQLLLAASIAAVSVGGYVAYQELFARRVVDYAQATSAGEALERFASAVDSGADVSQRTRAGVVAAPFAGRVVDLDGNPIEGALVRFRSRSRSRSRRRRSFRTMQGALGGGVARRTRDDGSFEFAGVALPANRGRLVIDEVRHPDYEAEMAFTEWAVEEAPVLRMRRAFDSVVEIEIAEPHSKEPVRFSVSAFAAWSKSSPSRTIVVGDPSRRTVPAETPAIGYGSMTFPMRVVAGAKNLVRITVPGGRYVEHELAVPEDHGHVYRFVEEARFDVKATKPGSLLLSGRVTDAETGKPIKFAGVRTIWNRREGRSLHTYVATTQTRMDGGYTLGFGEDHRATRFVVDHPDYLDTTLDYSGHRVLDVQLRRLPGLTVEVRSDGRALPGVSLLVVSGDQETRLRRNTDGDGIADFGLVNMEKALVIVVPHERAPDESALASRVVRLAASQANPVVIELDAPDLVSVTGTVVPPPSGIAMAPIFIPMDTDRGWIQARQRGEVGYSAGDVQRGRYLVFLAPVDDGRRDGPFALAGTVVVEGAIRQTLDFSMPTGQVRGRVVGVDRLKELRVTALPKLAKQSDATEQLFASQKLVDVLGVQLADDGFFAIENVVDGPFVVQLHRGSKVVAAMDVQVANGIADLGNWEIH
ncbi:MAG: RNA polymerase sigma factor [Planctomycetota bacterium]